MKNSLSLLLLLLLVACNNTAPKKPVVVEDAVLEKYRASYKSHFLQDPNSPLEEAELVNIDFFGSNSDFKIEAYFEEDLKPVPFKMPTYSGKEKEFARYGTFFFEVNGKECSLDVYRNLRVVRMPQYRDQLFLPFKDDTNDESTYGGGRYIDMKIGDIVDNKVVLDFNRCYNPWCAYSDGYNCPIPPFSNHLDVMIEAGEKKYKGPKKKRKMNG